MSKHDQNSWPQQKLKCSRCGRNHLLKDYSLKMEYVSNARSLDMLIPTVYERKKHVLDVDVTINWKIVSLKKVHVSTTNDHGIYLSTIQRRPNHLRRTMDEFLIWHAKFQKPPQQIYISCNSISFWLTKEIFWVWHKILY